MSPIACFFYVVVRRTMCSLAVMRPCLLAVMRPCLLAVMRPCHPLPRQTVGVRLAVTRLCLLAVMRLFHPLHPGPLIEWLPPEPPKVQLYPGFLRGQVLPGPLRKFLPGSLRRQTPQDEQYCQHTLVSMCLVTLGKKKNLK